MGFLGATSVRPLSNMKFHFLHSLEAFELLEMVDLHILQECSELPWSYPHSLEAFELPS